MKYYESHETAYKKIKKNNMSSWGEYCKEKEPFKNFNIKKYLVAALEKIKPISNARVLEIGCGTGPISCFLAQQGYKVDGFDVSKTAIEIAKTNAKDRGLNIHYSVDDICSISKNRADIYDIIVDGNCLHCITYDNDRKAALTNVYRFLKKGGYFIIDTMSIEDLSKWSIKGRIDEKGIAWNEVKEDYPYEKIKFKDKYWICTRRIRSISDLENELKQTGFLLENIEIHKDEDVEYMADFRAICRKPI